MKYVLYARKSTEDREDKQVLSIDSQIEEIQRKFPGLEVEIIRESKSAYKPYNRPEFQRMVGMFQEGKVQGLLAWHPDRLSREPISGGMVMHLLDRGLIKDLRFASYHFHHSPEGKMMLAMTLSQSKYSSEKLSVDVMRGLKKKCSMGAMPTRPVLGYMPDRMAEKGSKRVIKDPERFDLVRKMWDLMLTGQYPILKIVEMANKWGLTTRPTKRRPANQLSKSTVYKMFTNIFYTGKFQWDGEMYTGQHPQMISMDEYNQVQELLGRKYIPRAKKFESLTSGLIRCACGGAMVVEQVKKYIKLRDCHVYYAYARCGRQKKRKGLCSEPAVPVRDLEKQAQQYLGRIRISDAFHKWAIKNIQQVQLNEQSSRAVEVTSLRKAHDDCQKKLDNLLDLKISPENSDGSMLSDEDFKKRKAVLTIERDRLSESIKQVDYRADKWAELVQDAFDTAYNAQREFEETNDIQKKKLILAKVGANFFMEGGKLQVEAKQKFITFEKRLPELRLIEERGKMDQHGTEKPKKYLMKQLIPIWSHRRESNP